MGFVFCYLGGVAVMVYAIRFLTQYITKPHLHAAASAAATAGRSIAKASEFASKLTPALRLNS